MQDCMYSSANGAWETPKRLFDQINDSYGPFTLDVCASQSNTKCEAFIDEETDGLSVSWGKNRCWMNPPYGRGIGDWIAKAFRESQESATVVCLVPARTDTAWWQNWTVRGEITYLRGRVAFELGGKPMTNKKGQVVRAPFPSAIVVFRKTIEVK
jgi:phage N-6-adenine-methyltransferase